MESASERPCQKDIERHSRIGIDMKAVVYEGPTSFAAGKATPSWIVSQEISLDQAADAYRNFDARSKGWTKALIRPGMSNGKKEN